MKAIFLVMPLDSYQLHCHILKLAWILREIKSVKDLDFRDPMAVIIIAT